MYDIFGKYGAIRQIRLGVSSGTKVSVAESFVFAGCRYLRILDYREQHSSCTRISTTLRMRYAAVPYHVPGSHADIISRCSCDHLSGFNVCNRYLIVLYYQVRNLLFVNWSSESEYFVFPALKDAEKTRC